MPGSVVPVVVKVVWRNWLVGTMLKRLMELKAAARLVRDADLVETTSGCDFYFIVLTQRAPVDETRPGWPLMSGVRK